MLYNMASTDELGWKKVSEKYAKRNGILSQSLVIELDQKSIKWIGYVGEITRYDIDANDVVLPKSTALIRFQCKFFANGNQFNPINRSDA